MAKTAPTRLEGTGERAYRSSLPRDNRRASDLESGRWPEVRIVRRINTETPHSTLWRAFLDDLGERNYGRGTARVLGSAACTFIDAQSMGRMLERKFAKSYQDRRQTLRVQRRFADAYREFVRSSERTRINASNVQFETTARLIQNQGDIFIDTAAMDRLIAPDDVHEMRWNMASFVVQRSLQLFGTNDLALDLVGNEQLYKEFDETVEFCRHEGLNTNLITKDPTLRRPLFRPHISIFEATVRIGATGLQYAREIPEFIDLDAPSAVVTQ